MQADYVAYVAVAVFHPVVDIIVHVPCVPVIALCTVVIVSFLVSFRKKVSMVFKPTASLAAVRRGITLHFVWFVSAFPSKSRIVITATIMYRYR